MGAPIVGAIVGGAATIYAANQAGKAAKGQADAATQAAQLQAEGLDKQLALQTQQFNRADQLAQPAIQAGNLARNSLLYRMGLSPTGTSGPTIAPLGGGGAPASAGAPAVAGSSGSANPALLPTGQASDPATDLLLGPGQQAQTQEQMRDALVAKAQAAGQTIDPNEINNQVLRDFQTQADQVLAYRNQRTQAATDSQNQAQAAADADPNYGAMAQNFSAADLAADPLYDSAAVEQARSRSSSYANDPLRAMQQPAIDAANAQSVSVDNDPMYQQLQPAIQQALGRVADVNQDQFYTQAQPLVQAALARSTNFETSPGYEFRLAEGMKGVQNSAAAKGGLYSGAALKAVDNYNQGAASAEYGNWFNQQAADRSYIEGVNNDAYGRQANDRTFAQGAQNDAFNRLMSNRNYVSGANNDAYNRMAGDRAYVAGQGMDAFNRDNTQSTNLFNRLSSLSGGGQTATANLQSAGANYANAAGSAYGNYANAAGNIATSNANAQGAAAIAQGNIVGSGLTNAVNGYQQNQFLQSVLNKGSTASSASVPQYTYNPATGQYA